MKIIKNKLSQRFYEAEFVDEKEQNKYLRQIAYWVGYFIFAFNELERAITEIIAGYIDGRLDENEYAYIFLTGMQFNQKVELLERYYQYMLPNIAPALNLDMDNTLKKAKKILAEVKEMANIRNTIVHANYYSLDKKGNISSKIKFTPNGVEEHLVSITKDFLVESHNKALALTVMIEEFDEELEF